MSSYHLHEIDKENITQALIIDSDLLGYNIDKDVLKSHLEDFFNNVIDPMDQEREKLGDRLFDASLGGVRTNLSLELYRKLDEHKYLKISLGTKNNLYRHEYYLNSITLDFSFHFDEEELKEAAHNDPSRYHANNKAFTDVIQNDGFDGWIYVSDKTPGIVPVMFKVDKLDELFDLIIKVRKIDDILDTKINMYLITDPDYGTDKDPEKEVNYNNTSTFDYTEAGEKYYTRVLSSKLYTYEEYEQVILSAMSQNRTDHTAHAATPIEINSTYVDEIMDDNYRKFLWPAHKVTVNKKTTGEIKSDTHDCRDIANQTGLARVEMVAEKDNVRWVLFSYKYSYYSANYYHVEVPSDNPKYDYMDVGRIFIYPRNDYSFRVEQLIPFADIGGGYIPIKKHESNIRDTLKDLITADTTVIDENLVKRSSRSFRAKVDKQKKKEEAQNKATTKLRQKTLKLSEHGSDEEDSFTLNEVTYSPDGFEYIGQQFSGEKELIRSFYNDYRKVIYPTYTFDNALNYFIQAVHQYSRINKGSEFKVVIGDVEANVKFEPTASGADRFYINDKKINKDDVPDVLEGGLCYQKQSDYQAYVEKISKLSLRLHQYLHRGIESKIIYPQQGVQFKLSFPVKRKKNINYLNLGGNLYRIKDINRLISLLEGDNRSIDFVKTLTNQDIVESVPIERVLSLVKAAKLEYETAMAKSRKLLLETEEQFDIKAENHEFTNGENILGYRIDGKLSSYVIKFDPEADIRKQRCEIYKYPSGSYVCIIDKSNDQVGFDKLINRVYALHNDSLLVSKINTL